MSELCALQSAQDRTGHSNLQTRIIAAFAILILFISETQHQTTRQSSTLNSCVQIPKRERKGRKRHKIAFNLKIREADPPDH